MTQPQQSEYERGWIEAVEAVRSEVRNLDLHAAMIHQPHCAVSERNTHMRPDPVHVVTLVGVWLVLDLLAYPKGEQA